MAGSKTCELSRPQRSAVVNARVGLAHKLRSELMNEFDAGVAGITWYEIDALNHAFPDVFGPDGAEDPLVELAEGC